MTRSIDDAHAYPLSWPEGQRRTSEATRRRWKGTHWRESDLPLAKNLGLLWAELERLGCDDATAIVSTDRKLRRDGQPYASAREPDDPGVAVWFEVEGEPRVIACDTYKSNAQNVRAITKTIEALRGIQRWGACDLQQAFAGYAQLPAGPLADDPWEVLGLDPDDATVDSVNGAYRALSKVEHPDQPTGSEEAFARLNGARDLALMELERRRRIS